MLHLMYRYTVKWPWGVVGRGAPVEVDAFDAFGDMSVDTVSMVGYIIHVDWVLRVDLVVEGPTRFSIFEFQPYMT